MKFEAGRRYRMPVFFGPAPGPRQMPPGRADPVNSPHRTLAAISCSADAGRLESLLPPKFSLWGEPRLIVEVQTLKAIDWLAGRGYNTLGVKVPVQYDSAAGPRRGHLLTVLWENLADPIITGREDLGFSKLYCEIPDVPRGAEQFDIACSWLGFEFFRLSVHAVQEQAIPAAASGPGPEGVFHFKYFPRNGEPGEGDVAQVTFTPAANPNARLVSRQAGKGSFRFIRGRWEDLPTLHHVVDFLASLELDDFSAVTIVQTEGGKDLSDTVILP